METRVAIHCEPDRQWNAWLWRLERLLQENDVPTERVCSSSPAFWEDIRRFTHFIYIWGQWNRSEQEARTILPLIEDDLGLRCFPDRNTCRMFDNKLQQSIFLKVHNLPTPRTWVFWEKPAADEWAAAAPLPLVFKLKSGAGSTNVRLVRSRSELRRVIRRMFSTGFHPDSDLRHQACPTLILRRALRSLANTKRRLCNQTVSHDLAVPNWHAQKHYAYFQEFLPGNAFDTRITTIGSRAFGFIRKNRPGDFRASGSGHLDGNPELVDPRCVRIALEISQRFKFQSMAYDFLRDSAGDPVIVEMCYGFADFGVASCPGHWNADMEWQEGHCWPQTQLIRDFLEIDEPRIPPGLDRFQGYARFPMTDHVK